MKAMRFWAEAKWAKGRRKSGTRAKKIGMKGKLFERPKGGYDFFKDAYGNRATKMKIWYQAHDRVEYGKNYGWAKRAYYRYSIMHFWRPWLGKRQYNQHKFIKTYCD